MTEDPYASAAPDYWWAGWTGVLPLPMGRKTPPPPGTTGSNGTDPSFPDLQAWIDGPEGAGNIGLRMPGHVLGVDVDCYAGKPGAATIADREERWGPLPPTITVTSRDDGSGIRFYRIPEGLRWPGEVGPGVETVHRGHRYAVTAPSVHPEGRPYRWFGPDGAPCALPRVGDLPELPKAWVQGLTGGEPAGDMPRVDVHHDEVRLWIARLPAGTRCRRTSDKLALALIELSAGGSRHEAVTPRVMSLLRVGDDGCRDAPAALLELRAASLAACPGEERVRLREWGRMVTGAVAKIMADSATKGAGRPKPSQERPAEAA